jgi:protein-tyrosine phosphatase
MRKIDGCRLWVGHAGDVFDPSGIISAGILAVVDLALNEARASLPRDLAYCRFPLIDGPGNPVWLLRAALETVACLLRSNTPTIVVCSAGMSRSPGIAAAAIAMAQGIAPDVALALVLRTGPADVSPGLWADVRAVMA